MLFNSVEEYFKTLGTMLTISLFVILFVILVSKDARKELIDICRNL